MLTCQRRLYDLGAVVWQDSSHEVLPTRIGCVSFWATMWGHALTWTMSLRRGLALTYVVTSERSLNKLSITTLTTTTAHVRVSALISEHWCDHAHGECCGHQGHEDPSRFLTHCANPPSGAECTPLSSAAVTRSSLRDRTWSPSRCRSNSSAAIPHSQFGGSGCSVGTRQRCAGLSV
jgi:hypothetical protein